MKIYEGTRAVKNFKSALKAKTGRIPEKHEEGYVKVSETIENGAIFPRVLPKFFFEPNEQVFTIGSCFAREIETVLKNNGLSVPVAEMRFPVGEVGGHHDHEYDAHLLNEYNAGTILQRIENAAGIFSYTDDMGIQAAAPGTYYIESEMKEACLGEGWYFDMFLRDHVQALPLPRILERRKEIENLYKKMLESDKIIITLGLVEAWFDNYTNCYVNHTPSFSVISSDPLRWSLHRMDVDDVLFRMAKAIKILNSISKKNILITVSPVPLTATFTENNISLASCYSKSVLRIAAEKLTEQFDNVDYFPSYEIVMSFGTAGGFTEDNVHVRPEIVKHVTEYMLANYRKK